MSLRPIYTNYVVPFLFLAIGLLIICVTLNYPIGDFGNYYYGSKLLFEGKFNVELYKDIALFNNEILRYGETNYFENYIPVPPFSLLFYIPFICFKPFVAKIIFNSLSFIVLSFSINRFCNYLNFKNWQVVLIPICLFFSLYSNGIQGQTYVLITAILLEVFLASEKQKEILAALLLAITIALKLFPGFFIIYFIITKKYRIALYTVLLFIIIYSVTAFIVGEDVLFYYFKNIVPRLLNNDIVGTYYFGNQSVYTILLNLFSYDGLENTMPVIDNKYFIIGIESFIVTMVLVFLFDFSKDEKSILFSMISLSAIIIGRYNTSYSMLLLLPLLLNLIKEKRIIVLLIITIAINLPITYFKDSHFILQNSRIILLLLAFFILFKNYTVTIKYLSSLIILTIIVSFKYASYSIKPANYLTIQNTKGILCDYKLKKDSITLISTLGYKKIEETVFLQNKCDSTNELIINGNLLYYKKKLIDNLTDNKKKPAILNDSMVLFMSDLNQGIRFYKLRVIKINSSNF